MAALPVVHLLVPGLRGPLPPETRDSELWRRQLPAFARIFARARREALSAGNLIEHLRELFQLPAGEFPAGALGWLGEGGDPGQAGWLRADPVHLRPDRDQLVLFDAAALDLEASEAAALVAACNSLLREDGMELHAPVPDRWYLRADQPMRLRTVPVAAVAGRYLQGHLPQGEDAPRWLSLMTELQMLLHQASENSLREDAGKLTVNGVWFWGGGRLPTVVGGDWQTVVADEPIVRGLARASGATPLPVPTHADQLPGVDHCLTVLTPLAEALRAGDLEGWRQALEMLESRFLMPLLQRLQARQLAALTLETEGLRLTMSRRDLSRFWRRPQSLRHYLEF